ncbi:hypothetical protein M5K25_014664 [Dendrobium thyrsiflorum]|uniref:Disease resistance protein n=1 Tax=Dendrobium thyrsiflorum TaxID=117978 RepID=A0ABD0UNW6_DENTH
MASAVESLVSKVLGTLFNMAKEEVAMQLRLADDVKTLHRTLQRIQLYLQDCERKNIEEVSMKDWLDQINQDIYDIEDLLDDYNSESMSNEEDKSSSSSSTKVSFKKVASNHRIGVELQRLNKQLNDDIKGQIPELSLLTNFAPAASVESQKTWNQRTTAAVLVRSDIVGKKIQDDARRLIELLTKEDDRDNPLVYAIVGMGGVGKTTLAKLVFDDDIIPKRFKLKVWVSVSQNYNENDILRNIIKSDRGDGHDLNSLSEKLKDTVEGKRLFMVLDDVREPKRVWNDMLKILLKRDTAKGSRVLVTTRNEEVAAQMMAVDSQRVQPLPLEDGWSLLCKSAFPAWEQQEAMDDEWNLKDIGIKLVNKCDGLPLAINAIGGMLSGQSKTRESWEFILNSSSWEVKGLPDEINSALYISYQDLPSHIKRCFLYCSLFPKGRYFKFMNAKNLWIQEGLINDEKNISSHDAAENCFKILVQRNLVILDRTNFKMHDLFYSLSQFLTRNENLVATEEKEILNSEFDGKIKKLRRLSFIGDADQTTDIHHKFLQKQLSLRTLLVFNRTIGNIDNALFDHLRYLRTLWLQGTRVTELPASLGSLKLLRYLNLSQTPIKKLPKTIQKLKALRILDVSECENLRNLPLCIMKLLHLCSLTTKGSALDHLPPGLGNLNKLQLLEFIVPPDQDIARESSTVKELKTITELRRLDLFKLERVLDRSEAKSAALKDKQHLEELELSCSERDSNEVSREDFDRIEEVFEDLRPPVKLKFLKITNYFGRKLPSWLGSDPLFNFPPISVRVLKITGCSNCKKLDGLGLLPFLEELYIEGASSIIRIGPEFYTNNNENNIENGAYQQSFFPRMKLLSFENMDSWEEWSNLGKHILVMPRLEFLQIYACPKLKSFPLLSDVANSLKRIRICKAAQLPLKEVHNLPHLEIIDIGNIPYLERISGLPALQGLKIEDCPRINLVELTHTLQGIDWKDFSADSLPRWFSTYGHGSDNNIKATYLRISCKDKLMRKICFNEGNGGHEWSKIQHFDNITIWDENECLRLSYTKTPCRFTQHFGQLKMKDFPGVGSPKAPGSKLTVGTASEGFAGWLGLQAGRGSPSSSFLMALNPSDFPPLLNSSLLVPPPNTPSYPIPSWVNNLSIPNPTPYTFPMAYVPPSPNLKFSGDDLSEGTELWSVGYSLGPRPYYERLLAAMNKVWNPKGSFSLLSLADGFFLLKFTATEEYDYPYGPLPESQKIANFIEIPLSMDSITAKRMWLTFDKVCVQISKESPLPDEIPLQIDDEELSLKVHYDWKPSRCEGCGSLVHPFSLCPSNPNPKPIIAPPKDPLIPNLNFTTEDSSSEQAPSQQLLLPPKQDDSSSSLPLDENSSNDIPPLNDHLGKDPTHLF